MRASVGGEALVRLAQDDWPSPSVVADVFGGWASARAAASDERSASMPERSSEAAPG
jgi:hypothetical protein